MEFNRAGQKRITVLSRGEKQNAKPEQREKRFFD
jgi:hypothetical protein